jgi:hypothetical protein
MKIVTEAWVMAGRLRQHSEADGRRLFRAARLERGCFHPGHSLLAATQWSTFESRILSLTEEGLSSEPIASTPMEAAPGPRR